MRSRQGALEAAEPRNSAQSRVSSGIQEKCVTLWLPSLLPGKVVQAWTVASANAMLLLSCVCILRATSSEFLVQIPTGNPGAASGHLQMCSVNPDVSHAS